MGFSKVIPTSAESQRQWLQYKKNGGSPSVFMDETRPSADSGGSDGTTINVFLQDGQRKQLRAHLRKTRSKIGRLPSQSIPVFFSPNTRARNFEQTIRTIVPADFDGDASVAPYRIAFFAEVQVVEFMVRVRGRRQTRRRWKRSWVQTWTVDFERSSRHSWMMTTTDRTRPSRLFASIRLKMSQSPAPVHPSPFLQISAEISR